MKKFTLMMVVSLALALAHGVIAAEEKELSDGSLTVGGHGADSFLEGVVDLVAPVSGDEEQVFFVDTRGSFLNGPEEEVNLGFGYRRLLADPAMILGGNIFYDSRWTQFGKHFNQVGVGVEALSHFVDLRFNYYLPEKGRKVIREWEEVTVEKHSTQRRGRPYRANDGSLQLPIITTETTTTTTTRYTEFEEAMEGYDLEIGTTLHFLPEWLDTSIYCGVYNFWSESVKHFDGLRGRVEIRPVRALTIDAEFYSDDTLRGSDYLVGARLTFPFDFWNMRRDRSVFDGTRGRFNVGKRSLEDRMAEMIIRDYRVVTTGGQTGSSSTTGVKTNVRKKDKTLEPKPDSGGGGMEEPQ